MPLGAGTVDTVDVVLKDGWPDGPCLPHIPTSGFTGSAQNNVENIPRGLRLGTKVKYYDETAGGQVTMIYLHVVDAGATAAIAAGTILRPAGAVDNSGEVLYAVSNDTGDHMFSSGVGPMAIAISAVSDGYKCWAWCGGPPPQDGKAFCSVLAAATIATHLNAGHSATGSFVAGTAAGGDAGALIEVALDTQGVAGHITAVAGGTATV